MRLFILLATLFITSLIFAQNTEEDRGYIVKVGDMAPDFKVQLTNGESFRLADFKGKVVMMQFTASWCGVCRKEMPFIENEIWQELKNKDFVLIGIDLDEPIEKVIQFKSQTGITYPLALDPGGEVFKKYAHEKAGITRNVIVNKKGEIVYLTRLFDREEFDAMKKVIFDLVN